LQLRQPLYRPEIRRGAQARSHEVESQEASVEAQRRQLVRNVKKAYYRYRKAQARVEILEATQTLVRENRRTNQQLLAAAKVTKDAVHRAEAEVLSVRQKLTQARASVRQARRRLNVLRDRPADANIPEPQTDTETLIERRVRTLEQRLGRPLFGAGALADASGGSESVRTAVDAGTADGSLESARALVDDQPALEQLDAAAASAQRRAAQTEFLPTVSLAVDAGIQGTTYGFSGDKPFASASVVLEWNLFDGFTDHRRVQRRRDVRRAPGHAPRRRGDRNCRRRHSAHRDVRGGALSNWCRGAAQVGLHRPRHAASVRHKKLRDGAGPGARLGRRAAGHGVYGGSRLADGAAAFGRGGSGSGLHNCSGGWTSGGDAGRDR